MYNFFVFMIFLHTSLLLASGITPIPSHINTDANKVALGKKLFFDTLLSKDDTISCASCHILEAGGDDNLPFSFGINGQEGPINSPTVFNAVFNFRQFWDGRARDLQEQALGPIENPKEMGNSFKNLILTLQKTPYKKEFEKIYSDGINRENIVNAIAEYEKTLITPNSPFDQFLKGNQYAISESAKQGYEIFKEKGCIACHNGVNIGANLYNKFGVMRNPKQSDLGRFNVTNRERDKYYFKVPTLRNITLTAPYFHDGRHKTLESAVKDMAYFQLGKTLSKDELKKIIIFLSTLNGEVPENVLQ